jgi:hypothetical protein
MTTVERCTKCRVNLPKNPTGGLCYGCLGEPFPVEVQVSPNGNGATPSVPRAIVQSVPELAHDPDILSRLAKDIATLGLVGERKVACTVFLQFLSALLDDPVSGVVKGASSSGKSYLVQSVTRFFPPGQIIEMSGMSERALILSNQDYRHRTIVVYEAVALRERAERQSGNLTAYFIRSLVSEGVIRYPMSVKTKDGEWTTKEFVKEGPTNIIVTTTAIALHNENETRMLSLSTNDSAEQTGRVLLGIASEAERAPDYAGWHALHRWLRTANHTVTIHYGRDLAQQVPPVAVRLRRDFKSILSLIRAHALLHQATRETDERGRIVATVADYQAVRELILDVVSEGVGATVSDKIRETVTAVEILADDHKGGVPSSAVAAELDLDTSAAYRRLAEATSRGFVVNQEDRPRRPGRYVVGAPMPEEVMVLPENPWSAGVCPIAEPTERVASEEPSEASAADLSVELLKTELGAVDTEVLDFIDQQRHAGKDFTSITAGLKRMGFPPPPRRAAWDLAATVMAFGIRHP